MRLTLHRWPQRMWPLLVEIDFKLQRLFASKPAPTVAPLGVNGTVGAGLPANHTASTHYMLQNCARLFRSRSSVVQILCRP